MACYIERILASAEAQADLKELVKEASVRRRMSRVLKLGVGTAIESLGGVEQIDALDGIITATGWGCLGDSERFLVTMIQSREELLNPTPFIQSTFNTVGGLVALLRHNRCYNMTYAGVVSSFENALLDGWLRIEDGDARRVLVGAFDELTPTLDKLQRRMGLYRNHTAGEGALFLTLTAERSEESVASLRRIEWLAEELDERALTERFGAGEVVRQSDTTWYPTYSAMLLHRAVKRIEAGAERVLIYNKQPQAAPVVMVVECLG